jgi:hypothetical protein
LYDPATNQCVASEPRDGIPGSTKQSALISDKRSSREDLQLKEKKQVNRREQNGQEERN